MPFSPPEKLAKSKRNDCIRKWYRILSSKSNIKIESWNRYKFTKYKDAIIKFRDLRKEGNRKVLIFGCWKDF